MTSGKASLLARKSHGLRTLLPWAVATLFPQTLFPDQREESSIVFQRDFWQEMDRKIYRPPAYLEQFWCNLEMISSNPEDRPGAPRELILRAHFDVFIDFLNQPKKLFNETLVSLVANTPDGRVPAGMVWDLRDILKWGMNPIYLVPPVGQYDRFALSAERDGPMWKIRLRDTPEFSNPPWAKDRSVWVSPEQELAGYQYEDELGVHHYLFTWEPCESSPAPGRPGASLVRLKTLTVLLHQPGREANRVNYQQIFYEPVEGMDLPSRVTLRVTNFGREPGRAADFRYLSYKLKRRP